MNLDGLLNSTPNGGRASAMGGRAVDLEDDFGKLAAGVRSEDGSLQCFERRICALGHKRIEVDGVVDAHVTACRAFPYAQPLGRDFAFRHVDPQFYPTSHHRRSPIAFPRAPRGEQPIFLLRRMVLMSPFLGRRREREEVKPAYSLRPAGSSRAVAPQGALLGLIRSHN